MKTLRMRVVYQNSEMFASMYSCPDIKGNPQKTLAHVQKVGDRRNGPIARYELVDDQTYLVVKAARVWEMTPQGEVGDDMDFKIKMVRAGLFEDTGDILMLVKAGDRVQVITEKEIVTVDTHHATIKRDPMPEGVPV